MELKINVPAEVGHILEQKAAAQGQDITAIVEGLIKEALYPLGSPSSAKDNGETFEADMAALAESTEHLLPYTGNYSREDIYFDHD